jgi:hypothetical protein
MPSAGTPISVRIMAITGKEPAGTPAVPTPASMQMSMTSACWPHAQVDAIGLRQK